MEKSVTDAINFRRSVRKFDPNKEIDTEIVKKCIENGVLAPTSSNHLHLVVTEVHVTIATSH